MLFSDGNKMQDISRVCINFFLFLLYLTAAKQSFYAALSILNQSNSPEGNQLLHLIGSYLQLDSYIGLDVHTVSTLDAIEAELLVFNNALKVGSLSSDKF
jgi:hypothetical protein